MHLACRGIRAPHQMVDLSATTTQASRMHRKAHPFELHAEFEIIAPVRMDARQVPVRRSPRQYEKWRASIGHPSRLSKRVLTELVRGGPSRLGRLPRSRTIAGEAARRAAAAVALIRSSESAAPKANTWSCRHAGSPGSGESLTGPRSAVWRCCGRQGRDSEYRKGRPAALEAVNHPTIGGGL